MYTDKRVPLGIPDLDFKLGGGVLPGYSVLSTGEKGTGYRELLYTSATIHGNQQRGTVIPESSDVYRRPEEFHWPERVHYISLSQTEAQFERELVHVINTEWAETALAGIEFKSFTSEFISLSTVAQLLAARNDHHGTLDVPADPEVTGADYRQFLRVVGEYLLDHARESFVIVDGLTQLVPVLTKTYDWQETFFVLSAFNQLFAELDAVFVTAVDADLLSHRERGIFGTSFDGVLQFQWDEAASTRRRLLTIKKFRELLATVNEDELAKFELDLEWGGVGIKNIRRIPV